MKTTNYPTLPAGLSYETPQTTVMNFEAEGLLCQSTVRKGFGHDGLEDGGTINF